jgi:hypothetical protein
MALYLEGKPSVGTNELSPKEATQMSQIKYIGYVELDIADTMWPSGLCRGGVQTEPRRLGRVAIRGTGPLTTQHSPENFKKVKGS